MDRRLRSCKFLYIRIISTNINYLIHSVKPFQIGKVMEFTRII